jgi:N-acetyl-1-D-myo-inositol-2-amino-2-deoxy-alpha-D-glucopyranoside deacetylase
VSRVASLLAVVAHPGDEIFNFGATLAHYAASGVRVTVACATRGEAGRAQEGTDLGAIREEELRRSCAALGAEVPIFLGFRDSGTQGRLVGHDPLLLSQADFQEVESRVRTVIRQVQPHVILTFDPRGGNAHPDKRAVHQAIAAAFQFVGHQERPPQRLFLVARPLAFMRRLAALPTGPWAGSDPELYATSEATIAARIDTRTQRKAVDAARHAHASQALSRIPDDVIAQAYGPAFDEGTFALGGARGPLPRWPLHDLFEGLS